MLQIKKMAFALVLVVSVLLLNGCGGVSSSDEAQKTEKNPQQSGETVISGRA
jgi:uncharacterized protein YceK